MGQLMISYRGTMPPDWVLAGVADGRIAAICLFAYNADSPGRLREATAALHEAARRGGQLPPLIGIDQEGGQLMAVTGGTTELPGNMALGATRSEELAESAGRVLGHELLALGCNVDFAPVLDLADRPDNPVVGTRSFGDEPLLVAALGAAAIKGLQGAGLLATAKHFPGHGDTPLDSHHGIPVVTRARGELEESELLPFKTAIEAGVKAIMSAHVRYLAIDQRPATLSRPVLSGLLRDSLGFTGLALTDAMDMKAVADGPTDLRSRQAIEAGADLVLLGHLPDQRVLLERLARYYKPASLRRITLARESLPLEAPPFESIGNREHLALAQRIADLAVTLARPGSDLPLRLDPDLELALILVSAGDLTPADTSAAATSRLADQLRSRHPRVRAIGLPYGADEGQLTAAAAAAIDCPTVIVGTVNAFNDAPQRKLLRLLRERGHSLVHLALRSPEDLAASAEDVPCLCTYGVRAVNTEAAVRVLFGEITAAGQLPVGAAGGRRGQFATARGDD